MEKTYTNAMITIFIFHLCILFFFTTYLFTRGTSGRSFEFTWVFKYSDKVSNSLLHLSVIYAAIENNTLRTMNVMNFKLIKKYSQFLVSKHDLLEK